MNFSEISDAMPSPRCVRHSLPSCRWAMTYALHPGQSTPQQSALTEVQPWRLLHAEVCCGSQESIASRSKPQKMNSFMFVTEISLLSSTHGLPVRYRSSNIMLAFRLYTPLHQDQAPETTSAPRQLVENSSWPTHAHLRLRLSSSSSTDTKFTVRSSLTQHRGCL